ncbi:MAG: hypothetical protein U0354_11985 [Candidatus Sericytochromatia bacterium]
MKKIYLILTLLTVICLSCTKNIKQDEEKFERQSNELSTDEILVGDNIDFWDNDTPQGVIFPLNAKASFIKGFGLRAIKFKENNKLQEELDKLISTDSIYQLEVYELKRSEKIDAKNPNICNYIYENREQAVLLTKVNNLSFRLKEREWVWINSKISSNSFVFVRLGVADLFSVLPNKAIDGLWINAKRSVKSWEEFYPNEKKQIIAWGCQETTFLQNRVIEPTFYNPDIVFNYF